MIKCECASVSAWTVSIRGVKSVKGVTVIVRVSECECGLA